MKSPRTGRLNRAVNKLLRRDLLPLNSTTLIPVMRPLLPLSREVRRHLSRMDDERIYSNQGPLVAELEERIARLIQVMPERVVLVSSGTVGLQGACAISSAKSFRVPSFTFAATALAVANSGKDLAFVDVEESTMSVSTDHQVSPHSGLVDVRPFGASIRFPDSWSHGEVVVDAAASFGSVPIDLRHLPSGWSVVFSFHATKTLGVGEGGVVVFGDSERAESFREWINFGFRSSRLSSSLGTNGKMSEIHAAYGLAGLDSWESTRKAAQWRALQQEKIELEYRLRGFRNYGTGFSPYWIIRFVETESAQHFAEHLQANDIETRFWWPRACHEMPAFSDIQPKEPMPVSSRLANTVIGLPNFPGMGPVHFAKIERALSDLRDSGFSFS